MTQTRPAAPPAMDIDTLIARIRGSVTLPGGGAAAGSTRPAGAPIPAPRASSLAEGQAQFNRELVETLGSVALQVASGRDELAELVVRLDRGEEALRRVEGEAATLLAEVGGAVRTAAERVTLIDQATARRLDEVAGQAAAAESRLQDATARLTVAVEGCGRGVEELSSRHAALEQVVRAQGGESAGALDRLRADQHAARAIVEGQFAGVGARLDALDTRLAALDARLQEVAGLTTAAEARAGEQLARLAATSDTLARQLEDEVGRRLAVEAELAAHLRHLREEHTGALASLEHHLRADVEARAADVLRVAHEATARVSSSEAELSRRMAEGREQDAAVLAAIGQDLVALKTAVDSRLTEFVRTLESSTQAAARLEQERTRELEEMRIRVLRAERTIRKAVPPAAAGGKAPVPDPPPEQEAPGAGSATPPPVSVPPFDYFIFEHRFRGSRADIKQRQTIYLDLFRDRRAVLDLGCGRGEFVELLRENGVPVVGVDANADMTEYCEDRGLPVVRADLFEYLGSVPDGSVDGLFAAQVVEHFRPDQLLSFLGLCAAKLRRGGVVALETINPTCPDAMNWFYLDPTHVRPVPPELLKFMLEQAAFRVAAVRYSSPLAGAAVDAVLETSSGSTAGARFYQDYGVVATKP